MPNLKERGRSYPSKIIALLEMSDIPHDVESIRVALGIGNWNTALKHCLELVIDGKIMGMKTTSGWIFWIKPCTLVSSYKGDNK